MTRDVAGAVYELMTILMLAATPALAQDAEPPAEEVDATRLDVERLPPEAIELSRGLYEHGFFVEGWVGGRGFVGGVGRLSHPGVLASAGFGYEVMRWLWVGARVEGSLHETNAPSPPSPTAFEIVGAAIEVRLQLDLGARFAIWAGGEGALVATTGRVLGVYGVDQSDEVALAYGGTLGFDWHLVNVHYSLGVAGGARLYPSLAGSDGEQAIGVHAALYLRYVL